MEAQNSLFYECIEDAIKDDINALGGPKKAYLIFCQDKTMEQGSALMRAWANPERLERPNPAQYILLKAKAKEANSFACVTYEEQTLSCKVTWIEPEDELTSLLRNYIARRKQDGRDEKKIDELISRLPADRVRAVR